MKSELEKILAGLKGIDESVEGLKETVEAHGSRLEEFDTRLVEVEAPAKKRAVSLPGVDEEKDKFSFFRAAIAIATGDWSNAGFEKEVFEGARKKALSMGTDTAGGYIVPAEYMADIIEMLYAKSVIFDLGATRLSGLTGSPVEIPKVTGGATTYWVGENSAITDSDHTFGEVALSPKTVAAMTKISRRLSRMSTPQVEEVVKADFAKALALAIDLAGLRGSGVSNQPQGIANVSGINTVALGTNGATPDIDNLNDMIYEVEKDNAMGEKMGWAFHPRTWNTLRKLKDGEGRYYLRPDVDGPSKGMLLGFPYRSTTQIPINLTKGSSSDCSEIYLANWEELLVGEWGAMEIMASQETSDAFEKAQTWVRILQDVDIAVRHEVSFCLVNDARP